jgi:hypothetical protein
MGRNPSQFAKLERERERARKREERAQRRSERREQKKEAGSAPPGEDPDLAGIVPGPQPHPWNGTEPPKES